MPFTVRENLIFHRKDGRISRKKIFTGKYGFRLMKTGMDKFVNAGRMITWIYRMAGYVHYMVK